MKYDQLRAQREAKYAERERRQAAVNTKRVTPVNSKRVVNTTPSQPAVNTTAAANTKRTDTRRSDRHSAGYMAAYMKRRRDRQRGGA